MTEKTSLQEHACAVNYCTECGYKFECGTSVSSGADRRPKEDDISLCLNCAAIHFYNADQTIRPATIADLIALQHVSPKAWREVERAQAAIKAMPCYRTLGPKR